MSDPTTPSTSAVDSRSALSIDSRSSDATEIPPLIALIVLTLVAVGLFAAAMMGPANLTQNNEDRVAGYVWDAVNNGHWICQADLSGEITSKPPLYTWLAAVTALIVGKVTPFTLYAPSALAALLLAWAIFLAGRRVFGARASFLAGVLFLLAPTVGRHLTAARFDLLFALTVSLAAFASFRAWMLGRGWLWFWLAAAIGTLTKGPLCLLLGAVGLLAATWEKRAGQPAPIRGGHGPGILLFVTVTVGWLALAYWQLGPALIQKLIFQELIRQNVADHGDKPFLGFYKPFLFVLSGFAPWSLLTCLALRNVWRRPSENVSERRFERFLVCWLLAGLVIFALAAHQRARLIIPLLPAAALLGGRELAGFTHRCRLSKVFLATAVATLLMALYSDLASRLASNQQRHIVQTVGLIQTAKQIKFKAGAHFPLSYVDSPFPFQIELNAPRQLISVSKAAELLRSDAAAFIVVSNAEGLRKHVGERATALYSVARWPTNGTPVLEILGNRPELDWSARMTFVAPPFQVELNECQLREDLGPEFRFWRASRDGYVSIRNLSERTAKARVQFDNGKVGPSYMLSLGPNEIRKLTPEGVVDRTP